MKRGPLWVLWVVGSLVVIALQAEASPAPTEAESPLTRQPISETGDASSTQSPAERKVDWSRLELLGYAQTEIQLISDAWSEAATMKHLPPGSNAAQWLSEDSPLRQQLGDELFDAGLYAAERPNRVEIASVIPAGEAALAGFLPGDGILTYNATRVFTLTDLNRAMRRGLRVKGKRVLVRIVRDGEIFEATVRAGPSVFAAKTRHFLRKPIRKEE